MVYTNSAGGSSSGDTSRRKRGAEDDEEGERRIIESVDVGTGAEVSMMGGLRKRVMVGDEEGDAMET